MSEEMTFEQFDRWWDMNVVKTYTYRLGDTYGYRRHIINIIPTIKSSILDYMVVHRERMRWTDDVYAVICSEQTARIEASWLS